MRVVLDTNVVVSAILYGGNPQVILQAAISNQFDIYISDFLITELQAVLKRSQFNLNAQFIQSVIAEFTAIANWVEPKVHQNVIKDDPSDNLILDCAVAAEADYLITGDKHLLNLVKCGDIRIINPTEFISLFEK